MPKAKRGPGKPKSIGSAEELSNLLDSFIDESEEKYNSGIVCPPDDYTVCKFLSISSSTLDNYFKGDEDTYPGYLGALKKLVQYREHYYVRAGMVNPKLAGVTNFALKQKKNGGYEDRPTVQVEARELTIKTGDGMPKDSFS